MFQEDFGRQLSQPPFSFRVPSPISRPRVRPILQALHIVFNVALIVATAVLAHKDNAFPRILFPLFTMCFVIALFTPISFVRDTSQVPHTGHTRAQ